MSCSGLEEFLGTKTEVRLPRLSWDRTARNPVVDTRICSFYHLEDRSETGLNLVGKHRSDPCATVVDTSERNQQSITYQSARPSSSGICNLWMEILCQLGDDSFFVPRLRLGLDGASSLDP